MLFVRARRCDVCTKVDTVIDIPFKDTSTQLLTEVGAWLEDNMPNAPLPEEQRWSLGFDPTRDCMGLDSWMITTQLCLR